MERKSTTPICDTCFHHNACLFMDEGNYMEDVEKAEDCCTYVNKHTIRVMDIPKRGTNEPQATFVSRVMDDLTEGKITPNIARMAFGFEPI